MPVVIKLKGLPFESTPKDVQSFFQGLYLREDEIHMAAYKDGKASGIGFAVFSSDEDARKAMFRNGRNMGKRYIELFLSSAFEMNSMMHHGVPEPKQARKEEGPKDQTEGEHKQNREQKSSRSGRREPYSRDRSRSPMSRQEMSDSRRNRGSSSGSDVGGESDRRGASSIEMKWRADIFGRQNPFPILQNEREILPERKRNFQMDERDIFKEKSLFEMKSREDKIGRQNCFQMLQKEREISPERKRNFQMDERDILKGKSPFEMKSREDKIGRQNRFQMLQKEREISPERKRNFQMDERDILKAKSSFEMKSREGKLGRENRFQMLQKEREISPESKRNFQMDERDILKEKSSFEMKSREGKLGRENRFQMLQKEREISPERKRNFQMDERDILKEKSPFEMKSREDKIGRENPFQKLQKEREISSERKRNFQMDERDILKEKSPFEKKSREDKIGRQNRFQMLQKEREISPERKRNFQIDKKDILKEKSYEREERYEKKESYGRDNQRSQYMEDRDREDCSDTTCCQLFGLPFQIKESEIRKFFKGYNVVKVKLLYHPEGSFVGKKNGQGYVEFGSARDAREAAKKKHNQYLGSRYVEVKCCSKKEMLEESKLNDEDCRLFKEGHGSNKGSRCDTMTEKPISDLAIKIDPQVLKPTYGIPSLFDSTPDLSNLGLPLQNPYLPVESLELQTLETLKQLEARAKINPEDAVSGCVVGICNLPSSITAEEVLDFFYGFPVVQDSVRIHYLERGRSSGDAMITFRSIREATAAIEQLNHKPIGKRNVKLFLL